MDKLDSRHLVAFCFIAFYVYHLILLTDTLTRERGLFRLLPRPAWTALFLAFNPLILTRLIGPHIASTAWPALMLASLALCLVYQMKVKRITREYFQGEPGDEAQMAFGELGK